MPIPMMMNDVQDEQGFGDDLVDMSGHDMADLFDDPDTIVSPELAASYSEVPERLDELSVNGCCQKLSWSKTGGIAHITRDGQVVNIHSFARSPGQAGFALSKPQPLQPPQSHFQYPLMHLAWAQTGSDLAVFNSAGGVAIYTTYIAINRMRPTAMIPFEGTEAEGAVVGVRWLRPDRTSGICHAATREGNAWKHHASTATHHREPMHPLPNKSAFITAARNGTIRLCFNNANDASWSHISQTLRPCETVEGMLTHASFAPANADSFYLATHDISRTLSLYEVKVDWQYKHKPNQPPPPGLKLMPTIQVTLFSTLPHFTLEDADQQHMHSAELTHLSALPAIFDLASQKQLKPAVVALFSITDISSRTANTKQTRFTRVISLNIEQAQDALHSSFARLASRKKREVSKESFPTVMLERVSDIEVDGVVVSMEVHRSYLSLALVKADGTIETYDRSTMAPSEPEHSPSNITSVVQTGFGFDPGEHYVHYDMSPAGVVLVYRGQDDEICLKHMRRMNDDTELSLEEADAARAGQTLLFYSSCLSHHSSDDLLSLFKQNLPFGAQATLESLYIAMSVHFDHTADDPNSTKAQKLLHHPFLIRGLSVQQTLDVDPQRRSIPAKVAASMLELRGLCLSIMILLGDANGPANQGDLAASIIGLVKWFTDLVAFLVDDVLSMKRALAGKEVTMENLQEQINTNHTPTPTLLLHSLPRTFLRLSSRYIRTLTTPTPQQPASLRQTLQTSHLLRTHLATIPVQIHAFESFLEGLSHYCREAYDAATSSSFPALAASSGVNAGAESVGTGISPEAQRAVFERRFMVSGKIPEALLPVAKRLLGSSVEKLVAEAGVNPLKLFRMDFAHLNLLDVPPPHDTPISSSSTTVTNGNGIETTNGNKPPGRDILRKIPLPPSLRKYRRCTRCEGVMEDFEPGKGAVAFWVMKLGRTCICGNMWVLVERE